MEYSYLVWLLIFAILPLILLWAVKFNTLKRYKIPILLAPLGAIIFSFPWDYIAIKEGIWYFSEPYIMGIWLLGLPIEEWLFIVFETLLFASITALLWNRYGIKE